MNNQRENLIFDGFAFTLMFLFGGIVGFMIGRIF